MSGLRTGVGGPVEDGAMFCFDVLSSRIFQLLNFLFVKLTEKIKNINVGKLVLLLVYIKSVMYRFIGCISNDYIIFQSV